MKQKDAETLAGDTMRGHPRWDSVGAYLWNQAVVGLNPDSAPCGTSGNQPDLPEPQFISQ